ncbi:MAG: c-type cytochrome [Ignavibacteria bacterium]|nr:c-type cytochrome [Ignavibacteria bacterium]
MKPLFDFFEDEINFKEVFKHPTRWFGYIFIYFALIILALGIAYLNDVDLLKRNVTPYSEPDPAKLFQDVELSPGKTVEGVSLDEIKTPNNELIARGEELYRTTCQSCHGESGKGDGIASIGLNPSPKDFTKSEGWKNGRTITQVFKTLQEGIPGSAMVSYSYLSTKDKIALYYYISRFGQDFPKPTDSDFAELDAIYQITQTKVLPPTIPIPLAIQKISNEAGQKQTEKDFLAKSISNTLYPDYTKFIDSPDKLATFLTNLDNKKDLQFLRDIVLQNIPGNGVSVSFVYANKEEKDKFIASLTKIFQ